MFRIGQRVVCVELFHIPTHRGEVFPKKGEIYTIRDFHKDGMRLKEIINPMLLYRDGVHECAFALDCFRPVDETFGESVAEKLEKEFISQPEPALV